MTNNIKPLCCDICARQIEGDLIKLNINRYIRTMDFRPVKERTLCADCWDAVVGFIEDLIEKGAENDNL